MITNDSAWYYIISINGDPQPLSLAVNFAQLGLPAGSRYFVTEVSAARFGAQMPSNTRPCLGSCKRMSGWTLAASETV